MYTLDTHPVSVEHLSKPLNTESKLCDLILYSCDIDINQQGIELSNQFENNLVLPGAILREQGDFFGMLSRRRFLEIMARRYGPELFLKRAIYLLYEYAQIPFLLLPGETKIVDAIQPSLERSPELLYEPIVVQLNANEYRLLDVHHLLLAHTRIHELTTNLLHEQTEAKLLQTEKMASLGEMIAGVAHEILNPVNFISGNLEYLSNYSRDLIQVLQAYESEFPNSTEGIDYLKDEVEFDFLLQDLPQLIASMKVGAERLRKIIAALKSFSHMDEVTQRPVDIHEILDNTLLILNNRIKHSIEVVKIYEEIPHIHGFSGQISQVFTNIIVNAIDALLEHAEATSNVDWKPKIEIITKILLQESDAGQKRDWVAIYIGDNGPGIPLEIQSKIFETFFTTKPVGQGTGLGLAISRQIVVEKHGGRLNLQSKVGAGTTFEVLLPLNPQE
uniref:histidine kinase n=1 Tax=Oscillatoriales cyanobacterium SpSt-402 TaxID=2282168 RepID=A0A832H687_9CYAN